MTDAPVAAPEVEFVAPIMGFDQHKRFSLVALDEEGVLFSLRCLDDPDLRLIVMAPGSFFPGYAPELDDDTVAALDLRDATEAAVLCVVNPGTGLASATANLLAPVVINHRSMRAAQTVLVGTDLPLRAPLVPAA
ncbi:flagellar assembly protein FliW [Kineococcus sp. R8]|uniref:flagellar assembly protein FliW n=1 Tax=Kineococcus siccus TaxID=2696567 RepID=UPI0014132631|nr:flagellar assembly protein FliW [Kineococcus siccus]NAZ83883.1 flagellar assembly protein FliW [Kineococcus siccus]